MASFDPNQLAPQPLQPGQAPRPLPVGAQPQPVHPGMPPGASAGGRPIPMQPGMQPAVRQESPDEDEENPELASVVKNSPPWLVSGIIHMLVMIILGLWVLASNRDDTVSLEVIYAEELGEQLDDQPIELADDQEMEFEEQIITPEDLIPVEDPFATPSITNPLMDAVNATADLESPVRGMALNGRTPGMKPQLLKAYGGTALTEGAVEAGLAWLYRNQHPDGSWSLIGPYSDGGYDENREAATAMALIAFQGANYTHRTGKDPNFVKAVTKGWDWLLKQQDADGNFFKQGRAHHQLYTQAQCTIALCELFGMTGDEKYKEPAERAVKYCLAVQSPAGGWRYYPGTDADTSVTGWFVMALQSAKMAYINVPQESLDKIGGFLDQVQADGGRKYGYQGASTVRPSMSAEGLLCRQYLGWKHDDKRLVEGTSYLTNESLLSWGERNSYYWYYATQVCHHMEGDHWKKWNEEMRELLPRKQEKKGAERGSWDPLGDQWGPHGGRLMVTCLHIYMLEVYYRHLPIYKYQLGPGA